MVCVLILTQNASGYIPADLSTNSSGHPGISEGGHSDSSCWSCKKAQFFMTDFLAFVVPRRVLMPSSKMSTAKGT
jgi:hypothetical protein